MDGLLEIRGLVPLSIFISIVMIEGLDDVMIERLDDVGIERLDELRDGGSPPHTLMPISKKN